MDFHKHSSVVFLKLPFVLEFDCIYHLLDSSTPGWMFALERYNSEVS